jgi:hypothetical protein
MRIERLGKSSAAWPTGAADNAPNTTRPANFFAIII